MRRMSTSGGTRAIVAAFLANLGIAVAKFAGFLVTGSSSMLAESIHSVADTGNQGLLLLGNKRSQRDATAEHPFGFGRERYFWSFIVAVVLFLLGGVFALFEGYEKVVHPHQIESAPVALVILLVAMGAEGMSFRTAMRESSGDRRSHSLLGYIRRSKSPELPVVLLEDFAALTGLVCALTALGAAVITGDGRWDGVGTLAIGTLLVTVAGLLAVEMKSLLIGESASPDVRRRIVAALEADEQVDRVIHLRTEHLGPEELLVGTKVAFAPSLDAATVAAAIDRAEAAIRADVPEAHLIYIEPDLDRALLPRAGPQPVLLPRAGPQPRPPPPERRMNCAARGRAASPGGAPTPPSSA